MSMTLISTVTVGSGGAASIDFNSIAATFTDLKIVLSTRGSASAVVDYVTVTFNGSSANQTGRRIQGNGATASSNNYSAFYIPVNAATSTSNTFGNAEIYIPNYAGSANKVASCDAVQETNASTAYQEIWAWTWANTAAITSISLALANHVQHSTASLYGITRGSGGATTSP
jgi:hypothetical protein